MSGVAEQAVNRLVPLPLIVWNSSIRDFSDEDIQNMATSLRVHGQIHAIVCKPLTNGVYEGVCGRLRYEGAKWAKIPEVLVRVHEFESESEVKAWQLAENLHRRDLTTIQKADAYKELYELEKKELDGIHGKHIVTGMALGIQEATGDKAPAEKTIYDYMKLKELPEQVKEKIRYVPKFGMNHGKQLLRLKDKPKEQLQLAEEFTESTIKGRPLTLKQLKQKVNHILNPPQEAPPLPEGVFNVIYADPPWKYNVQHLRGTPEYPTMNVEKICGLQVPTSEDAVLFLWATNPMLEDALEVMRAWGFRYKTNLVWVKNKFGTGFYVRGQHELLLIGVKGNTHGPEESNRPPSVLNAPVRNHSQKPNEVYEIIEQMYPNSKFLELFARDKREDWESWGNEV